MKYPTIVAAAVCLVAPAAKAGPEQIGGQDFKQVESRPAAAESWYGDREWDITVWGGYVFTGTQSDRSGIQDTDNFLDYGTYDRLIGGDHAWGGGVDLKYFVHRYFGLGLEGFGLAAESTHALLDYGSKAVTHPFFAHDDHAVGGALATFTLRCPIGNSRFAPYGFAAGGGVFGGRDDHAVGHDAVAPAFPDRFDNTTENRGLGQFGGGLEIRITRHVGITGDFSWNVVDGPKNNFGTVRSGLSFAFW